MMEKIKKIIQIVFGTQNNILIKLNFSFFISATLFLLFSIMVKGTNLQAYNVFSSISGILFGIWLSFIRNNNSTWEFFKELFRLFVFFIILILSLNFCINSSTSLCGFDLIIGSVGSCIGIVICSLYFISKFIDIFIFIKKLFQQVQQKLFESVHPTTSKLKALVENITAFLVSIAGLGVAIKAIIEPLISIFKYLD